MQDQYKQAHDALKNEAPFHPALAMVIERVNRERLTVMAEIAALPEDQCITSNGRSLINKEQELHTTLSVLRSLWVKETVQEG